MVEGRELEARAESGANLSRRLARPMLFALCFAVISLLVWLANIVRVYLEPSQYAGQSMLEFILPEGSGTPEFEREFEILKSQGTLDRVVDRMALDKEWSLTAVESMERLEEMATFDPVANHRLARVTVHHTEASLAAKLADAIPAAYAENRLAYGDQSKGKTEDLLEVQIMQMQDRVEKARVKWLDVTEQYRTMPIEGSPVVIHKSQPIDPRSVDGEDEFSKYLAANRQMIVAQESRADYDLLAERLHEMQRQLVVSQSTPKPPSPIAVHQNAVIPSVPALPDVEGEMAAGKTGAILTGLVGALVALLLIPLPAPKPDTEKEDGEGAD